MTFARRIAIGAIVASLVPLCFALLIYLNLNSSQAATREVAHAREALALAADLHRLVLEMEWSIRGFRLSGDNEYLDPYWAAFPTFGRNHERLRTLLRGHREERLLAEIHAKFLDWHRNYAEPKIDEMRASPPIRTSQGILVRSLPSPLEAQASKRAIDDFRQRFQALEESVRSTISIRLEKRDEATARLSTLLWIASSTASLLLLGGTAWLFRSYRLRSQALFAGLEAAERGKYQAVPLSGRDELATIASAFNRTLAEIERRDVELHRALEEQERLLSEKSAAHEALRASESKLQGILDNTSSVIYVKDLAGRYLLVNRRFAEVLQRDPKEIVGKTNADVFGEEVARTFQPYDATTLQSAVPLELEEVMSHEDGPHTYLSVKFPLRDERGVAYALAGISTDITGRKRAEEEINRFFDLALEGLCIAGFDGYFKRLNPVWEKMLGFSVAELASKPFIDFVHPDDRDTTIAEAQSLYSKEHETVSFTNRYRCADGSYKWLVWNARSDASRRLIYAAARDVSEEKRRQDEVRQLNEQLARRVAEMGALNKELEAFSYSVSHDLRAPLRHIAGFAQLLKQSSGGSLDEKGSRYLRTIADAARRMGHLIDDLLVFSRMGRTEMNEGSVDLNALTENLRQDFQSEVNGRNVVWKIGALPKVRGDASMLRQVLINLMSNALKYTGTRDRAEIEIGVSPNGGSETVVFVRDNGVGFDMQYAHKLFGVFQRLHRIEDFEGTGVGLANVRRIIERHGGRTWAEGELDRGATFYFSLPTHGGNS